MHNWKELTDESKKRWELNAEYWDSYVGDTNNRYYNQLIEPNVLALLAPQADQRVLDIGCGTGNFSRTLAALNVIVTAFDSSEHLIAQATSRSASGGDRITYLVKDATDYDALMALSHFQYDAAVSNMTLMDMADITALSVALPSLLRPHGVFVFSVMHPCFQPPHHRRLYDEERQTSTICIDRYSTSEVYEGKALAHQPVAQLYFHRPLEILLTTFLDQGFVLTGIREPVLSRKADERPSTFNWDEIPPVIILRFLNTRE